MHFRGGRDRHDLARKYSIRSQFSSSETVPAIVGGALWYDDFLDAEQELPCNGSGGQVRAKSAGDPFLAARYTMPSYSQRLVRENSRFLSSTGP
jgi:hypothetical protein